MQVFLSWSGDRSRAVAAALSDWLAKVIQAVEPWMSIDIDKGARWNPEIAGRLGEAQVGIVCVTPENLTASWLLFEAGALSKNTTAHVCTFLVQLTPAEVQPPLGQFQHTVFEREDIRALVRTINQRIEAIGEKSLPEKTLDEVFETYWPDLERKIGMILADGNATKRTVRSDREILEEILEIVRGQESRLASRSLLDLIHSRISPPDTAVTSVSPLRAAAIASRGHPLGLADVGQPDRVAKAIDDWVVGQIAKEPGK